MMEAVGRSRARPLPVMRIVTLTTDFGFSDPYVGAVKGVLLSTNPEINIVDISNGVNPFDLLDGGYTLAQAYRYFPSGTIHLVVVDPGVNTNRRPLVVRAGAYTFVAPDNGVLSLVYEQEPEFRAFHVTAEHYFRDSGRGTFQGRDLFAPVAGWLTKNIDPDKFGPQVSDVVRFALPKTRTEADGVHGVVLKTDRFGNLITNLRREQLPELNRQSRFELRVGKVTIQKLVDAYAEGGSGELFAIWGSAGFLEISGNRAPAARLAGAERGAEVVIKVG